VTVGDDATGYDRFRALPLKEQIGQLDGHLERLVAEQYAPAQWRLDKFYQGGNEREELKGDVQYGDIRNSESTEAGILLSEWIAKHDEGPGRFATLAEDERSKFASYVLLPEVIIAICLRSLDLDRPSSWARPRSDLAPPAEAAAEAEAAADEEARQYKLARQKLDELAEYDHATEWERIRHEVKMAQRGAQQDEGIPPAPEPAKPTRRAARLRDPEQAERAEQKRVMELYEKKSKRAKQKKGKAGEMAPSFANAEASTSANTKTNANDAEADTSTGAEVPQEASLSNGVEAPAPEPIDTDGGEAPKGEGEGEGAVGATNGETPQGEGVNGLTE
jgi:hypothetical protein